MQSYARFYPKLFQRLIHAPAFASRQEAETWLREAWTNIHIEAGASKRRIAIMRSARICPEQGWRDIDQEVCYLESPEALPIRLHIHKDGTLVVQQMHTDRCEILLAKPGRKAKAPAPCAEPAQPAAAAALAQCEDQPN